MDRLILLRHGKAEADATSGQDFDRALTERGRRDTVLVCKALAKAGLDPDLVLVSPAARTLQTWEAGAALFARAEVRIVPALYDLSAADVFALAQAEGRQAHTVLIVGHNPGLGDLSARLAQDARAASDGMALGVSFPAAAASVTHFDPPAFSLYAPKALGGGS